MHIVKLISSLAFASNNFSKLTIHLTDIKILQFKYFMHKKK